MGAGYDCNLAGCAVPAIHSAHESFFQATPGYIGVRDDLQEGHVYGKRLCGYASRCQFPLFSSTKSGFLCFIWVWNPCFRAFRAQNRGFCAFLGFGTLVFGLFEHKIEVFVRFCPPEPPFSGLSSTKSRFLCAFRLRNPHFRAFRAQNRHFCARVDGDWHQDA